VHHLLEAERKLCVAVFERRPEAMPSCFAEIAARAGILDFLKFGRALANTRKDSTCLNKLRLYVLAYMLLSVKKIIINRAMYIDL